MALDERLHRELERAARPADPSGIYEDLLRRRGRRQVVRRIERGLLAVGVIAGSIAGVYGLAQLIRARDEGRTATPDSPQGRITLVEFGEGDSSVISSVDLQGTGRIELARADVLVTDLDWSPDGQRLAYGRRDLFVLDLESGVSTRITPPDAFVSSVSWSPDGRKLAIAVERPSDEEAVNNAIYVMNADGSDATLLTEAPSLGWTDWSPDGSRILFVGPGPDGYNQGWDIYVMNADGSDLTNLTNSSTVDLDPSWSPDGSTILFRSRRDEPPGWTDTGHAVPDELYLMAPDGSNVRRLTNDRAVDQSPVWSPDGAWIAFTSFRGQAYPNVYMMRTDGTERSQVTDISAVTIAWQPAPTDNGSSPSPTLSESPTAGNADIGLGFPVCNVTRVMGEFTPGTTGTMYVATRVGDTGRCPQPDEAFNVIAIDAADHGEADTSYGPIECSLECRAFSAPDLDGDGTAELLVVQGGGSVLGLGLFDVSLDESGTIIEPVTVAPPGDPEAGFEPGEAVRLLLGGDEFYLYTLRCGDPEMRDGPGLVFTAAESLPHDSPDAEWHAHQITFALRDGMLDVVDVGDFTEPAGFDLPSFQSGETLCGSNLGP